jgi:hypothetical protein
MRRIPIAELTRDSAKLMVYYDDYQDDIENNTMPPHLSYPLPDYTLEGDADLIEEFEDFVNENDGHISCRYHFRLSWSKAHVLAQLFAEGNSDLKYENLVPEEESRPDPPPPPGVIVD